MKSTSLKCLILENCDFWSELSRQLKAEHTISQEKADKLYIPFELFLLD